MAVAEAVLLNQTKDLMDANATSSSSYAYDPTFEPVDILLQVPYQTVFEWEAIEINRHRIWMGDNWTISLWASAAYLAVIFSGKYLMRDRKPFQLRGLLTLWNIGLAAFSAVGFFRTAPELFNVLKEDYGFHKSVCIREGHNAATAFWALLMVWSKLVELGDTAFIVLKKQPLIFLHWYHHITVLVYVWGTYAAYGPSTRYFMSMNFFVHAIMYAYYACKALRIRVSRNIAMMITFLQSTQMFIGIVINLYLHYATGKGRDHCPHADKHSVHAALAMYATYFILFLNFFYQAYFSKLKKA